MYCGFFAFEVLKVILAFQPTGYWIFLFIRRGVLTALQCAIVVLPYIAFQWWGYTLYCSRPDLSPWCEAPIPHMYGYVQSHYWNQGLFNYWELKQLPNFLIASPMIVLSLSGILPYAKRALSFQLEPTGYYSWTTLPYIVYWAVFLLFAVTRTHVQTITRFFSSIPPVYWFAATLFQEKPLHWAMLTLLYFLLYNHLGIVLYCNFYPWT